MAGFNGRTDAASGVTRIPDENHRQEDRARKREISRDRERSASPQQSYALFLTGRRQARGL